MKTEGIFHFLGCCVIAAAIVVSGALIASRLPETALFPSSLSVSTSDGAQQFGDYLSPYEASAYLNIPVEELLELIESGQLDSAVYQTGESCIISRQALQAWIDSRIGS